MLCVCVFLFWVDTWFDDDESGQISSTRPKKNPNGSFLEGKFPLFFRETGWLVKYYS